MSGPFRARATRAGRGYCTRRSRVVVTCRRMSPSIAASVVMDVARRCAKAILVLLESLEVVRLRGAQAAN